MLKQLSRTVLIGSLLTLGACSFQKEPGTKTKLVTETVVKEVKVKEGITEEDLNNRVRDSGLDFPDLLQYAYVLGGDELMERFIKSASPQTLNELGRDGDTMLMMAAKAGDHEFFMKLLLKGASPYVPSRGTHITPLDVLKDAGDSWNYIRSQLSHVEEKFAKGGYSNAVGQFVDEYANNRFPMTKAVNGHKPHIYYFIEVADSLKKKVCGPDSLRSLLETIERLEGPIEVAETFEFARAMLVAEDQFAFEFFKNKMRRDFTAEERIELIRTLDKTTLTWIETVHHLLDVKSKDELDLMESLIKAVVENTKKDVLMEQIHHNLLYGFIFDNYPNAFLQIQSKINGSEVLVMEHDGDPNALPVYDAKQTEKLYKSIFEGNYRPSCH